MNRRQLFRAMAGGAAAVPALMAGRARAADPIEATATLDVIVDSAPIRMWGLFVVEAETIPEGVVMVGALGPELVGLSYDQLVGLPRGSWVGAPTQTDPVFGTSRALDPFGPEAFFRAPTSTVEDIRRAKALVRALGEGPIKTRRSN